MPKPLNKVSLGLAAGALTTIIVWALKAFAGIEAPAEVASAATMVIYFVVAYFVPLSEGEKQQVVSHANYWHRATAIERASGRVGRDNTR